MGWGGVWWLLGRGVRNTQYIRLCAVYGHSILRLIDAIPNKCHLGPRVRQVRQNCFRKSDKAGRVFVSMTARKMERSPGPLWLSG